MRKPIIKKGDKYNKLTAVKFDHNDKRGGQHWLFKCDCGNEKVICVSSVKRGASKSCGCLENKRNIKHEMWGTRIYRTWNQMKQRCNNPKNPAYKDYGARGIKLCKRWNSFENFLEDMGDRPKGMSIDRINNRKGYSKENCRWADRVTQQNNTRRNYSLTYKGKTKNISQWSKETGINYHTLYFRITRYNWSIEKALNKNL